MSVTFFKPRSPSPNLLSSPFEKTTHGIEQKKEKKTRLRTVRRCQAALAKLSFVLERHENQCWERCRFARFSPETRKGTKISAETDAKWHVSPRKLEKFRLDRYRAVDRYRGVDRYSESKLEPLTAVWPCPIAVHGPIKVFWTAYRAVDRYRGRAGYRVPHIYSV